MFIALRSDLGYIQSTDGDKEPRLPNLPPEAVRSLGYTELHMTFLPKTADARQELLTLLIAIPLSLMGTGFFFYLLDGAARVVA